MRRINAIIRIQYTHHISNTDLCKRYNTEPLRIRLIKNRRKLFGHIIWRPQPIPAQLNKRQYYLPMESFPLIESYTHLYTNHSLKGLRLDRACSRRLRNTTALYAISIIYKTAPDEYSLPNGSALTRNHFTGVRNSQA